MKRIINIWLLWCLSWNLFAQIVGSRISIRNACPIVCMKKVLEALFSDTLTKTMSFYKFFIPIC